MATMEIRRAVSHDNRLVRLLRVFRGYQVTYTRAPMFGGETVLRFKLSELALALDVFQTVAHGRVR